MRALLFPLKGSPHARTVEVTCLNRTGRDQITVQPDNRTPFAVARFRLRSLDGRRILSPEEFANLHWRGKGEDPLTLASGKLFNDEVSA